MKKRLLGLLLSVVMVIGFLPCTALAASDTVGSWGSSGTWEFEASTGTLTLWGNEAIPDYGYSWTAGEGVPWFSLRNSITSVVISEGITHIGSGAFGGEMSFAQYESLVQVTLPSTLRSIGAYAFSGSALTSVSLPSGLTSIGNAAFAGTELTSLYIPTSVSFVGDDGWFAFDTYALSEITVAPGNQYFEAENNVLYNKGKTQIIFYPYQNPMTAYVIPSTITETLYINDFSGRDALRSITIPANVTLTAHEGYNPPDGLILDETQSIILYFQGAVPEITSDWCFIRGDALINIDARKAEGSGNTGADLTISLSTATTITEGTPTVISWNAASDAFRYYVNIINTTTGIYYQKDAIVYGTSYPLNTPTLPVGTYEIYVQSVDTNGIILRKSNTIILRVDPKISDQLTFVKSILTYSTGSNLNDESRKSVENAIYNLLFKAYYRPTGLTSAAQQALKVDGISAVQFDGSLAINRTWPLQNNGTNGSSVYDPVLGTIPLKVEGRGCASYGYFCFSYVYGTSGTYRTWLYALTASQIKNIIEEYADPGERIGYSYSDSYHSIVFLGENSGKTGFYYINYNGGVTSSGTKEFPELDVRYISYEDLAAKAHTFSMHDATAGLGKTQQITKTIVRIACPVEAVIILGQESLDSRNPGTTSFGCVKRIGEEIIFELDYNSDYQLYIDGIGEGVMTLTLEYYADETLVDSRKYVNMPITFSNVITSSVLDQSGAIVLYTNDNMGWVANSNETVYGPENEFSQMEDAPDAEASGNTLTPPAGINSDNSNSTCSISTSATSHGTVTVSHKSATINTTITITVIPDNGYKLDSLIATDASGNVLTLTDKGNGEYTFTMPASKITVAATFAKIQQTNPFADVKENDYFYDAVLWAIENSITAGTSATTFSPNATCTRAQAVTFLWRAAGSPAPKSSVMPFTDVAADAYYHDAVLWAVEQGITVGTSATTFSPDAKCTRAQIVTFLWRSQESPVPDAVNPFPDVAVDAYYADAVLWAVENEITAGTSATTFSPNDNCTRAQIVTFLYRSNNS